MADSIESRGVARRLVPARKTRRGFTLVEMLIAVIILAVVGTTLSTAVGSVSGQTFVLERRALAHWIAQNEINRLRIDLQVNPRVLPEGRDSSKVYMADREWDVLTEILSTDNPVIRRVEVDVYEVYEGERQGPFEHSIAFLGRQ